MRSIVLVLVLLLSTKLNAECYDELYAIDPTAALMRDLVIVEEINTRLADRMPVTFNYTLSGGYFNMHSARMGCAGSFRGGFSSVPPYYNLCASSQPFSHLEITLAYRIYRNVPDPILSPMGFGDLSDRGVNAKLALALPEDSGYLLPGIAIGADDFLGTKGFKSLYIVATKVWPNWNLEASLGYGAHRIKGLFGGILWMPWRHSCYSLLNPISLAAEYDATDYKNPQIERHPKGGDLSHRINYGLKYRLWDCIDLTISQIRGRELAWSVSTYLQLGAPWRLLPPIEDPTPYCAPVVCEPIGYLRTETMLAEDLVYAFRHQGFDVWDISLVQNLCDQVELRLNISTDRWMFEDVVYDRVQEILIALTPTNIDLVVVTTETRGFPVQEYRFRQEYLAAARAKDISRCELAFLTQEREATCPCIRSHMLLYKKRNPLMNWFACPKVRYLFGSSTGKFKYAIGGTVGTDGFVFNDVFYRIRLGYIATSSMPCSLQDVLNPSQLPNVHTDVLTYYKVRAITVDEALLQKNINLGRGFYTRVATGLFSQFYGGFGGEILYYPLGSCWAVGFDIAKLYKRTTEGINFTKKIRKFDGETVTYIDFSLYQYFVDFYYIWQKAEMDFRLSIGRFLAGDKGGRIEVGRTYESGLRLYGWYTYTDGHDKINGQIYHDQGVGFSMPIDIFLTKSSNETWGESISAWLRDVGYRTDTGDRLFDLIHNTRL